MAEEGNKVFLNVYDITEGLARQLSTTYLGTEIEAIWHTGVVVYGNEYYFEGGIKSAPVGSGTSLYGTPIRIVNLGVTHVPKDLFEMFLQDIAPHYTAKTYSLITHNCNHFSNKVAQFLVGVSIPDYILNLPNEVINSPAGPVILRIIQKIETSVKTWAVPQAPQFRPSTVAQSIQSPGAVISTTVISKDEQQPKKRCIRNADGPSENAVASKVQEEIASEFAAIMATGTLSASEAAALAARRVMERYGNKNTSQD